MPPPPVTARGVCTPPPPAFGAGEDTLAWSGGDILEDARHCSVLYVSKYFVSQTQDPRPSNCYLPRSLTQDTPKSCNEVKVKLSMSRNVLNNFSNCIYFFIYDHIEVCT